MRAARLGTTGIAAGLEGRGCGAEDAGGLASVDVAGVEVGWVVVAGRKGGRNATCVGDVGIAVDGFISSIEATGAEDVVVAKVGNFASEGGSEISAGA